MSTTLIDKIGQIWQLDTGQDDAAKLFDDIRTLAHGDAIAAADLVLEKGAQHPELELSDHAYDQLLELVLDDADNSEEKPPPGEEGPE